MFANIFSFKNTPNKTTLEDDKVVSEIEAELAKTFKEKLDLSNRFAAMEDENILLKQTIADLDHQNSDYGNALLDIVNEGNTPSPNATVKRITGIAKIALGLVE